MIINEITKSNFITKSKSKSSLGRYSRRSQISNVSINRVGLLELNNLGQPNLDLYFQVGSATGSGTYDVSISMLNFMDVLRYMYYDYIASEYTTPPKSIKRSELRKVVQLALRSVLDNGELGLYCSCPDFKYRFAYLATVNQYNFSPGSAQDIPALIRNPDNQGSGCKHLVRVLTMTSKWQPQVVTAITNMLVQNPQLLYSY